MVMQINLAPDLKQERIKVKKGRQLTVSVLIIALIIAIAVPIILTTVRGAQLLVIKKSKENISEHKNTLNEEKDLGNMLTVQNNLSSIPNLYEQRSYFSHMIELLPGVIPVEISLDTLDIGADGAIAFTGSAPNHAIVEKFYTALRFSGVAEEDRKLPEFSGNFSNVMLDSVSSSSGDGAAIEFVIKAEFKTGILMKKDNEGHHEAEE
jgi:hypothetical protein